jgi:hypothetical protein
MLFVEKMKQFLGEERMMPQRKFAAGLGVETTMCGGMRRGESRCKREQIAVSTRVLQTCENMVVTLWIADKINADEKELARKEFRVAQENIK